MQTESQGTQTVTEVNEYRCPDCDREVVQDSATQEPVFCRCEGTLTLMEFERTVPYLEFVEDDPYGGVE